MPATIIVGTQWGDEGKGKITDYYAAQHDMVVRFQGGSNAGHTVVVGKNRFAFHHLPSGILRSGKVAVIANGVVVDPELLVQELSELNKRVRKHAELWLSDRANVVMPYHRIIDGLEEQLKSNLAAGTTRRGIGPCYADKVARFGIRVGDLLERETLNEKLKLILSLKEKILDTLGEKFRFSKDEILKKYLEYGQMLRPYVCDTAVLINKYLNHNRSVLFEGAQGAHLDIDHGIYPFVTSSNTVAGAACTGAGIGPTKIDKVIGVVKAYTTRVGSGPFPTELKNEVCTYLQESGLEFGTTTGRRRRCGWLDLVMVKYAVLVNGIDTLAITKLDVLGGLKKINVAVAYEYKGKFLTDFPASMRILANCKPVYQRFDGWSKMSNHDKLRIAKIGYSALPNAIKRYLKFITTFLKTKIELVSIGDERSETVECL